MLRCENLIVLNAHPFANITFHPRKSQTNLVGQKLTNRTNTTVPQVVNIIHTTDTFCQVEEIAHFSQDISWCYSPNLVRWVRIANDGHNTIWIARCDNLELLQFYRLCQDS